jgi:hypothetical protein
MGSGLYSKLRVVKARAKPGDLLDAFEARREKQKTVKNSSTEKNKIAREGLI